MGDGYKLYYHGETNNRNGIGIIVSQKWRDNVLNINRITDRIMALQLVIAKGKMNVLSVYTPQTGCTVEEKETFWRKLDGVSQRIPASEKVILAGDMNGHVGTDRSGVERWHGCHGYGSHNEEGRTILQCAQMYHLAIASTFFENNDQHLITYRSGDRTSTIDYIMVRRDEIRNIKDCKVIPGECVATQHRLVVMEMKVGMTRKPRPRINRKRNGGIYRRTSTN